ncbi:MAG: glycosyltransferase family 1 protein, partial [Desulfovibrio sp.]|nr:glycosyltransferase family 1 protein [Desulfovibrio sp.]
EFPDKARFFAALRVPENLERQAYHLITTDAQNQPNIHWWYAQIPSILWPGKSARLPGLGCENASQNKRFYWLQQACALGFEVVGDTGWKRLLPQISCKPPVDYYTHLADLYYQAKVVLNVNSLQLPASLNQRHFDVWAAGGCLLTDASQALKLFPDDLTKPILLSSPKALAKALSLSDDLKFRKQWRECLAREHTYVHRLDKILDLVSPT